MADEFKRAKDKRYATWKQRSVDMRTKLVMSADARPWTSLPFVSLHGLPRTCRISDAVDICFREASIKKGTVEVAEVRKGLWCNPSQNIGLFCKAHIGHPGTWCKSSTWYSYEFDCTLSGQAQLQMLGWGSGCAPMDLFSESETRSLSGDGFSVAVACVVSGCMWLNPHGPWWSSSRDEAPSELDS